MAQQRVILHSDMNSFYASVEMMLDPSLKGKAVAVCGATEDRHGIVLAKSELAKKAGVKTGMVNWEAKQRCPGLILVPPQYDQYLKYSKLAHQIYYRYTDLVEPFGMDECWLDLTGSGAYGTGMEIAQKIRTACREELGLTVSIGVSFNKIFAKLGSDLKKPDAVTQITKEDFREKVWPLAAAELIYVGRATEAKLARYGVHTIGELAAIPPEILQKWFGVGDLEKSSFSNIEQQSLEFVKYTLDPWIVRWEQSMTRVLLTQAEKKDYFIKFNLEGLLRGDYQSRMNGYSIARQNGWMSANDIRELENLDRIPAEQGGDLYLINGSMLPLGSAGAYADINPTEKEETEPNEDPSEEVLGVEESGGRRPGRRARA